MKTLKRITGFIAYTIASFIAVYLFIASVFGEINWVNWTAETQLEATAIWVVACALGLLVFSIVWYEGRVRARG